MKILSFQYRDKETNWEIEPINFNSLTLLVGASGVGKTRILKSIQSLKKIAQGKSLNGVIWSVSFSIDNDNYIWSGEFELKEKGILVSISEDNNSSDKEGSRPSILEETIIFNGETLIKREKTILIFKGDTSPVPIKAEQSVLTLIPDPVIQKIEKEFKKITYSNYTNSADGFNNASMIDEQILSKYKTLDNIRNSDEDLIAKLFWVYKKDKKLFTQIKEDFKAVFPQIDNLKIAPLEMLKDTSVPFFLKAAPFIQFKEDNMIDWVPVMGMSAGMYRTLIHIIELYLSSEGTIILIDEFENSLGVNCIDELTTEIKGAIHRIQFIITSHHPYIINNISYNNWKIVTRNGCKVSTQDAKDLNLGKSKHEAFLQLLNLPSYKTGRK
jgi:predicted ATPase